MAHGKREGNPSRLVAARRLRGVLLSGPRRVASIALMMNVRSQYFCQALGFFISTTMATSPLETSIGDAAWAEAPEWEEDVPECRACKKAFSFMRRRHHCRCTL